MDAGANMKNRPATILIVDDQEAVRRFIVSVLAPHGYRLLEAPHGDAAAEIASREGIDLLIADVVMPGMSGPELEERLSSEGRGCPCLLISGAEPKALPEDLPFLRKPFDPEELVAAVHQLLEGVETAEVIRGN